MTTQTRWTVDELLATHFPDPNWIVPGLLAVGFGSLSGRPKMGKSLLALRLALAVGSGGRFLGKQIQQGHVLYLALEDGPRRLKERLHKMHADPGTLCTFETAWRPLNGGSVDPRNGAGMRDLLAYIRGDRPKLVVIDTLTRACAGRLDWNDVGAVTALLGPLQEMAHSESVCILPVDHMRKTGGFSRDVVEDLMGSTAKSGISDSLWGLYRKRGERTATLAVTGRDIEEQELAIEWDPMVWDWKLLGAAGRVITSLQADILKALEDLGQATASELAVKLGKQRANIVRELGELVFRRRVRPCRRIGNVQPYELVPDDPIQAASF